MRAIFDPVTLFGLAAVSLMLLFNTIEHRRYYMTLCFSGACLLGSLYGFMQGAWPFGLLEGVWAIISGWRGARRIHRHFHPKRRLERV